MTERPLYSRAQLQPLISPRRVAIVGVSAKPSSFGHQTMLNLDRGQVPMALVSARGEDVAGRATVASVRDIDGVPDCAVVAVSRAAVIPVLEQCADKGIRGAIVYASGFAETGRPEDVAIQQAMQSIARDSGLRILGPNTMGLLSERGRLRLTFFGAAPDIDGPAARRIGIVSQSGGMGFALAQAACHGYAFSHVLTAGNACDVDVADQVAYLAEDPDCDVIACLFEGLRDPMRLMEAGQRAARAGKPVVVYKLATGEEGRLAAQSHTGSLAGSAEAWRAAFERYGFIEAPSFEALLETAAFVAKAGTPSSDGVAGLATSGGAAILIADRAEALGVSMPQPDERVAAVLRAEIPEFGAARNPCDVTAQILNDPASLPNCARAMLREDAYGTLILPHVAASPAGTARILSLGDVALETGKVACCVWLSQWLDGPGAAECERHPGVALFRSMDRCLQAIAAWQRFHRGRADEAGAATPAASTAPARRETVARLLAAAPDGPLAESASRAIVAAYGVPVATASVARDADEAVALARALGVPVAMKVDSPQIPHKTEAKALRLDVEGEHEVRAAFAAIVANALAYRPGATILGVTVQPMLRRDAELIVGARRDPHFGTLLVVGFGGVLTEVVRDTVTALAPVGSAQARRMLERLRSRRLLEGFRGAEPADLDALAAAIRAIGDLHVEHADLLEEIDVNPVVISRGRPFAVDALVVRRPRAQ